MAERLAAPERNSQFSASELLAFISEYEEKDADVAAAVKERKDLRIRIKGAGIPLVAFDQARSDSKMSGEERERRNYAYARIMAFLGKPVGTQAAFAFDEDDERAFSVHELKTVDNEGYEAGKRGDKVGRCSYTPGTEAAARWMTAWARGQADKVAEMGDPAPKRAPGRPRRATTNGVTEPNVEARQIGAADGIAGHRANADRWPPGTYGNADYELGHADGQKAASAL